MQKTKIPLKAIILYLIVLCAIVAGVTVSMYTSSFASPAEKARVAKFDVSVNSTAFPSVILNHTRDDVKTQSFTVTNSSEVAVKIDLQAYYDDSTSSPVPSSILTYSATIGSSVSENITSFNLAPNQTATVTCKFIFDNTADFDRKIRITYKTTQID